MADKYSVKKPCHLQVVTGTQRLENNHTNYKPEYIWTWASNLHNAVQRVNCSSVVHIHSCFINTRSVRWKNANCTMQAPCETDCGWCHFAEKIKSRFGLWPSSGSGTDLVLGSLPFRMIALKTNVDVPTFVRRSLEAQMPAKAHCCPSNLRLYTHYRLLYHTALCQEQQAQLFTELSIDLLFDIEERMGLCCREGDVVREQRLGQ